MARAIRARRPGIGSRQRPPRQGHTVGWTSPLSPRHDFAVGKSRRSSRGGNGDGSSAGKPPVPAPTVPPFRAGKGDRGLGNPRGERARGESLLPDHRRGVLGPSADEAGQAIEVAPDARAAVGALAGLAHRGRSLAKARGGVACRGCASMLVTHSHYQHLMRYMVLTNGRVVNGWMGIARVIQLSAHRLGRGSRPGPSVEGWPGHGFGQGTGLCPTETGGAAGNAPIIARQVGGSGMDNPSLQAIYNYRSVSDRIGTSGMPTEDQLADIARAGFEVVINLDQLDSRHALPDERGSVEALGLTYLQSRLSGTTQLTRTWSSSARRWRSTPTDGPSFIAWPTCGSRRSWRFTGFSIWAGPRKMR